MKNFGTIFISWVIILPFALSVSCAKIYQEEGANELVAFNSIGVLPTQPASITVQPSDTNTREQLQ